VENLQPLWSTVLFQTCILHCVTLDSSLLPPPMAEFTKFQNDIAVKLQLHPDAFASAMINCFPHHSLMKYQLTDIPVFCIAVCATDIPRGQLYSRVRGSDHHVLLGAPRASTRAIEWTAEESHRLPAVEPRDPRSFDNERKHWRGRG
jgi:hypothetical protein